MYREGDKGLSLTLSNGSVWTVTEASYLTELTIDASSAIVGADGAAVTMTVDGAAVPVAAGTYAGEIVITPAAASGEAG